MFFEKGSRKESEFERLYNLVSHSGEIDRVIQACYENYLNIPFNDPLMTRVHPFLHNHIRYLFDF
jgi:hypothetical protein